MRPLQMIHVTVTEMFACSAGTKMNRISLFTAATTTFVPLPLPLYAFLLLCLALLLPQAAE